MLSPDLQGQHSTTSSTQNNNSLYFSFRRSWRRTYLACMTWTTTERSSSGSSCWSSQLWVREQQRQNCSRYLGGNMTVLWLVLSPLSEFVFRIFDTDKNGFISHQELTTIVKHLFHLVPQSDRETETTPEKVSKFKVIFFILKYYLFCSLQKSWWKRWIPTRSDW